MLSCAFSSPPDRLTIHVPAHPFLHVDTRVSPADDVYVDERGVGKTSLCPGANHTVELEIVGDTGHHRVRSDKVEVRRTGDGFATSLEAPLPQ